MPSCSSCTELGHQCIFDKTLDQRRRVAAKRTSDELKYYRSLFNDLVKIVRKKDQSDALKLLAFIQLDKTPNDIRTYLDSMLEFGEKGEGIKQFKGSRVV